MAQETSQAKEAERRKLKGMKNARVEANDISLGRYDFSWDNEGTIEQMTGKIYAGQYASRFLPLIGKTVKQPAGVDFVTILEIKRGRSSLQRLSRLETPATQRNWGGQRIFCCLFLAHGAHGAPAEQPRRNRVVPRRSIVTATSFVATDNTR